MTESDAVRAYRYAYGKAVTEPGGPIPLGDGYRVTSISGGMPECLKLHCRPGDLLDNRSTQALVHPKRERDGALFFRPACCEGQRWMIASCARARPEGGEVAMSRTFTLLVAYVFAADDWARWAPRLLANTPRWLKAEPDSLDFVERGDFPQVRIASEQLPLDPEQNPGDTAKPLPLTKNPLFWRIADALENPVGLKESRANLLVGTADRIGSLPVFMQALGFAAALLPREARIYLTAAAGFAETERAFAVQYHPDAPPVVAEPGFFAYYAGVQRNLNPDIDLATWQEYWQSKHPDDPLLDEVWPRLEQIDAWESAADARRWLARCMDDLVAERSVSELRAWLNGKRPEPPKRPRRHQPGTATEWVGVLTECMNGCVADPGGGRAAAAARAAQLLATLVQPSLPERDREQQSKFWAEAWCSVAEHAAVPPGDTGAEAGVARTMRQRKVLRWSVLSAVPFPSAADRKLPRDGLGMIQDFTELRVVHETLDRARAASPEAAEQIKTAVSSKAFNDRLADLRKRAEPILVHNPYCLIHLVHFPALLAPRADESFGEDKALRSAVRAIHLACLLYHWVDVSPPAWHAELLRSAQAVDTVVSEPREQLDEARLRHELEKQLAGHFNDFLARFFRSAYALEAKGTNRESTLWQDAVAMTLRIGIQQSDWVRYLSVLLTELDDIASTARSREAGPVGPLVRVDLFDQAIGDWIERSIQMLDQACGDGVDVAVIVLTGPESLSELLPRPARAPLAARFADALHEWLLHALGARKLRSETLAKRVLEPFVARLEELVEAHSGLNARPPPLPLRHRLLESASALIRAMIASPGRLSRQRISDLFDQLDWLCGFTDPQGSETKEVSSVQQYTSELSTLLALCLMRWAAAEEPRPYLPKYRDILTRSPIRHALAWRLGYPGSLYFGRLTPASENAQPNRDLPRTAHGQSITDRLRVSILKDAMPWSNDQAKVLIGRVVAVGALRAWRELFGTGPAEKAALGRLMVSPVTEEAVTAAMQVVQENPPGYRALFDKINEHCWYIFACFSALHGSHEPYCSTPTPKPLKEALLSNGSRHSGNYAIMLVRRLLGSPAARMTGLADLLTHRESHSHFTSWIIGWQNGWADFARADDRHRKHAILRLLFLLALVRNADVKPGEQQYRFAVAQPDLEKTLRLNPKTAELKGSVAAFFDENQEWADALGYAIRHAGLAELPGWPDSVQPKAPPTLRSMVGIGKKG